MNYAIVKETWGKRATVCEFKRKSSVKAWFARAAARAVREGCTVVTFHTSPWLSLRADHVTYEEETRA